MNNNILSERVQNILEWNAIIEELSLRCSTSKGKIYTESIEPLDVEDIKNQHCRITELKELINQNEAPDFSGIDDIESPIDIAAKGGILSFDELFLIREFIIASNRIRGYIKKNRENLRLIVQMFSTVSNLMALGDQLIFSMTDNRELSTDAYPQLKNLKNDIFNIRQTIEKKISRMVNSPHMEKILQEKIFTTRNGRYVILVKSNWRRFIQRRGW